MTRLPPVLASEYCADFVEQIPLDVRLSASDALTRIALNPERFPNADWDAIDAKFDAIESVGAAWYL